KQMDYLMPSMTASYEVREESIGAFVFSSSTEKYAIDRIESKRALQLHEDIVLYELIVNSINDGIAQLEHEEKAFIELRYFKNQTITATAANLGYSERQIFSIRKNVMGKLLISLKNIVKLRII
ncbi:MAG: sigma-70 family RNA polymerase sigma factor, partial [Bacillus sp. (in: firmicutes)]